MARKKETPVMTPDSLHLWRHKMGLTQKDAASALDISYGYYRKLEEGLRPIRRRTRLACWALTQGKSDYSGPKA